MNPYKFSKTIQKIHEVFYGSKLSVTEKQNKEVKLQIQLETFSIENHIKTRYRITFPDYVGKISTYRNLFGYIMKNGDNICDTSDFIDLPVSHVIQIHEYITKIDITELLKLKSI